MQSIKEIDRIAQIDQIVNVVRGLGSAINGIYQGYYVITGRVVSKELYLKDGYDDDDDEICYIGLDIPENDKSLGFAEFENLPQYVKMLNTHKALYYFIDKENAIAKCKELQAKVVYES